jgi:alanine racemase
VSGHLRELIVDLDAIASNTQVLATRSGSAGVMAVVKADAYGHGLVPSAKAAIAGGAQWLGVALLDEALALRAGGVEDPVLAWLVGPGEPWAEALTRGALTSRCLTCGCSMRSPLLPERLDAWPAST